MCVALALFRHFRMCVPFSSPFNGIGGISRALLAQGTKALLVWFLHWFKDRVGVNVHRHAPAYFLIGKVNIKRYKTGWNFFNELL